MKLAAIDIGTNSVHMIVVHVRPDLSFEVVDREKEMVRLGAGGLDGRALTPDAMQAALQVLSKFRRLAESHGVDATVAVATSAVREAENGGEFLRAAVDATGIRPRVISGQEEARLIHLAAAYGVGTQRERIVALDIGGGSVEVTRGSGAKLDASSSFKLGVIRMTERFVKSDPITPREERRLVRHVNAESGAFLDRIKRAGFERVVGTSGTILSLGSLAADPGTRGNGGSLRNRRIPTQKLHQLRKVLTTRSLERRLRLPGLDPRRADLCVAGSIVLDTMLARLGAPDVTLCDLSLREGIVLDYISRHRKEIDRAERYPNVRQRSVIELAERCAFRAEHAAHIARLALSLFDQTRSTHGLTSRERNWLEYGALLHDIGTHISYEQHHKHSYYLIKNGDLRGFDPDEIEVIALLARYHRRGTPKRKHEGFKDLPGRLRKVVLTLAAILRLAESLDRSHAQLVSDVSLRERGGEAVLRLKTTSDAELEVWAAARHREPFEQLIGKPLRVEAQLTPATDTTAESRPKLVKLTRPRPGQVPGRLQAVGRRRT